VAVFASTTVSVEATAQSPAPPVAMPAASTSETLQEVTVTAKRLDLAPVVRKFVNQIAHRENGEGLARWDTPVCPTVSGLPRQEVEFILTRIAQIARAGLTDWDQTFLKSLYATNQKLKTQSDLMAKEMVRDISP
jgi:hypothetical protein